MKNLSPLFVILLLLFSNPTFAEGIKFEHLSLKEAQTKAEKEGKLIFIDLFATWCGPCKSLSSSTFKDADLGKFMNEHFINLKIDGEQEEGNALMYEFDLGAYPTMLFLDPEGKLIRKIEGFVDAETVQSEANFAKFPETTEIFIQTKEFTKGKRDKRFLQDLIELALIEDQDHKSFVTEYLRLYPDLDLNDAGEFIVFGASSNNLDDKYVQKFLANAKELSTVHGDLAQWKISLITLNIVEQAIEKKDKSSIKEEVDAIYPAYSTIMGSDGYAKTELVDIINEMVDEEI